MTTLDDLRGKATISVREAAELTGFGRDQVYAAIHRGEFPALRLGRSIRVPVPQLLTWLGCAPPAAPPDRHEADRLTDESASIHQFAAKRTGDGTHHEPRPA